MPTKTFLANKSSLFAVTGSTELGGGQDQHLPIGGPWSGYTFTAALRFALDWSNVVRITSAVLQYRTTTQVHVGFSSAPDFYVARATADWTANGNAESWGTSPTVYPGPASTTTGRVSERAPTSESTNGGVDITAIVRAWAPTSVEGGGGAANYGVLLSRVASGDLTEIWSFEAATSGFRPSILLTYESDAPPPAPTITSPTAGQIVTTPRPVTTATSVDPDGDPLQAADIEYRKGGVVVLSQAGFVTGVGATSITYTPASDLPSGDLTVRFRAKAGGVYGAWSAELPFVVDRPPVVGAFSSPPASVSGTRRPPITFATSDADADALEYFDVEVYQSDGGSPSGSPVYVKTNLNATFSGANGSQTASHTPTADLPPGDQLVRTRVRARGVWSAWSAYRAFTVVVAAPSLVWVGLTVDGGFFPYYANELADPTIAIGDVRCLNNVTVAPPSGQTITKAHCKIVRLDGPTPGSIYIDADIACPAAGGTIAADIKPATGGGAAGRWVTPYGSTTVEWSITASGGGVTTSLRRGRFAMGEWYGSVALGDSASGLAAIETPKLDAAAFLYRAQSSPTAAFGAAGWVPKTGLAALALPATNAYLGLRSRIGRRAEDAQIQVNGSFEDASADNLTATGWLTMGAGQTFPVHGFAVDGSRLLRAVGDGATANPGARSVAPIPVLPGVVLRLRGYARRNAGSVNNARLALETLNAAGGTVSFTAIFNDWTTATSGTYWENWYTVPADGSVASVRVWAIVGGTAAATEQWLFDDVSLRGMGVADAGFDRLQLDWQSLG